MNIQLITPKFSNNVFFNKNNVTNPVQFPSNKSLSRDTVSFTGAKSISDSVWSKFVKELPRLNRIGMTYLDATEAIATRLKDDGVVFVRDMFEATVVKEPDSKLSKVNRSKTFEVRDAIRTIMFVKNPYDVSILFEKIIPEYKKRGYGIADIFISVKDLIQRGYIPFEEEKLINDFFEMEHSKESHQKFFRELKKLKYDYSETKKILAEYLKENKTPNKDETIDIISSLKKEVPDVDIRLKKNKINVSDMPDKYKYALGSPQKSGYEDIQVRFIRDVDTGVENPIYHELLIQFGPTYNKNAFKEHKLVYEPIRMFDELNINMDTLTKGIENYKLYPENGVSKFISDIRKMFRENVSSKLIQNGKNEDFFNNIEDNEEIYFSAKDIEKFERKFKNIKGFLIEYYKQAKQKAQLSLLATELVDKEFKSDLRLINKIKAALKKTIDDVNYEHGLKDEH